MRRATTSRELVDPAFARGLRAACDRHGAVLVLDDVRCGLRLDVAGSWEPLGVRPDLSAFSKAIANGHPLACVAGIEPLRAAATSVYTTGSFWFAAAAMAASVATIGVARDEDVVGSLTRAGHRLRTGLAEQAASHGVDVAQTGPVQMPMLTFADDPDLAKAGTWAAETVRAGALVHPWHNWFISAAHTDEDIERALAATDAGFAKVRAAYGTG
jgi:glutamate-1-semialdehyde 2,1-aminomutase